MNFFFQAEDGIRDGRVTGVQTCALPIWFWNRSETRTPRVTATAWPALVNSPPMIAAVTRSEERRVGKSVEPGGRRMTEKTNNERSALAGRMSLCYDVVGRVPVDSVSVCS